MRALSLSAEKPHTILIYYCKAGLKIGLTIRVEQAGRRWQCRGVALHNASACMTHNNSTGKAKASGARCVLQIFSGTVEMLDAEPI